MEQLKSGLKLRGRIIIIDDNTGKVLVDQKNMVVAVGLSFVAALLSGGTVTQMTYTAVGSGSTSPTSANVALEAQIGARQSSSVSCTDAYTVQWQATFGAGVSTGNWYEAGVFNASTSGVMLCRVTYGLLTKGINDSFTLQYRVSASDDGV